MAAVRLLLLIFSFNIVNYFKVISAILSDDSCESDEDLSGPRVVYRILPESLWM